MLYKKKALSKSNGAGQNEHVRHTPPFLEYQMNEIHLDIIISFWTAINKARTYSVARIRPLGVGHDTTMFHVSGETASLLPIQHLCNPPEFVGQPMSHSRVSQRRRLNWLNLMFCWYSSSPPQVTSNSAELVRWQLFNFALNSTEAFSGLQQRGRLQPYLESAAHHNVPFNRWGGFSHGKIPIHHGWQRATIQNLLPDALYAEGKVKPIHAQDKHPDHEAKSVRSKSNDQRFTTASEPMTWFRKFGLSIASQHWTIHVPLARCQGATSRSIDAGNEREYCDSLLLGVKQRYSLQAAPLNMHLTTHFLDLLGCFQANPSLIAWFCTFYTIRPFNRQDVIQALEGLRGQLF